MIGLIKAYKGGGMKKSILFLALVAGAFSLKGKPGGEFRNPRKPLIKCPGNSLVDLKYGDKICSCTVNKNGANYTLSCDLCINTGPGESVPGSMVSVKLTDFREDIQKKLKDSSSVAITDSRQINGSLNIENDVLAFHRK